MKRASFTIETTNGTNYDAICINPTLSDDGDSHPMVSFICSGRQLTLRAEEIKSINFGFATWCGMCDEKLNRNIIQK